MYVVVIAPFKCCCDLCTYVRTYVCLGESRMADNLTGAHLHGGGWFGVVHRRNLQISEQFRRENTRI